MFSRNVDLGPPLKSTPWRKVAVGTWRTVGDPSVYGVVEFDATQSLKYIEKIRAQENVKITLTHYIGKVVAKAIAENPQINGILRFGKIYPRKSVDVFFQVASDSKGNDLSGTTLRKVDLMTVAQIAREMEAQIDAIRKKGDPVFKKSKNTMKMVPGFLVRYVLDLLGFVTYSLNLWSPLLGSPKDPFGSVMITNVGSLGLDFAFAPLVPYSRIPLLIAVGAVRDQPIARNGKVEVAPMLRLCATFDHRLVDGVHASHMVKSLQRIVANPEQELGLISESSSARFAME